MSDPLKRHNYVQNRILITSARILSPEFAPAYLRFSGAQIELMRNLLDYGNRETTFVDSYEGDHYFTPSDEDLDSLFEIVADLEEILMGNINIPFGYSERLVLADVYEHDEVGIFDYDFDAVPEGETWWVQFIHCRDQTAAVGMTQIMLVGGGESLVLAYKESMIRWESCIYTGLLVLSEGDYLKIRINECAEGDDIDLGLWGYKMLVPT